MKASALVERYRFALEVIAQGPEWEPGTKTARLALLPPEVSAEALAIQADMDAHPLAWFEAANTAKAPANPYEGMSVAEAVEQARAEEMASEPEPVDTSEFDAELDEAAEEVGPPQRVREAIGKDGLTATHRDVLAFIQERGEVNKPMIMDALPRATKDKVDRGLRILRDRGLITAEGETNTRTYRPAVEPEQDKPTMPDPEPAPSKVVGAGTPKTRARSETRSLTDETRRNGTGSDEGRVLEAVKFKPHWSIAQHAARLDLHQDRVAAAIRKLEAEDEIKSEPRNGRVVWSVR